MTKEDNEELKVLMGLEPHTKHFERYNKFYFMVTGKQNQSSCSKCSIKRIYGLLTRYINGLN